MLMSVKDYPESLAATGNGSVMRFFGTAKTLLTGTWVGTVGLYCSGDGGTNYRLLKEWTAVMTEAYEWQSDSPNLMWRYTFTRTSGTAVINTTGFGPA